MEFFDGTLHIALVYAGLFLLFCVPPYTKQWKRLVDRLDRVEFNGKRLALGFYLVAPLLLIDSIVITHLFQYHKELKISFWTWFAPASFLVIPLFVSFFGVTSWEKAKKRLGLGRLLVLLFSYGGFGVAGTNFHDVLWCGRRTRLYTEFFAGGNDLDPWVKLFNVPSYDYRTFGFYMLIQALLGLAIGHVIYFRFLKINGLKRGLAPLGWNWAGTAYLAFAITLIDWPRDLTPPLLHTSIIAVAIIIACALFHKSGLALLKHGA